MMPTIAPCTMKIPMMLRGLAPSVRRIAMSACLSVTAITSVRHQVERRHRDDQREDDEHHAFLDLHGGEPGACSARPVADQELAAAA